MHPFLRDHGSVTDHRSRLEVEFLLAELEDFPDVFWVEEWLSTADIELLHPGFTKEPQSDLRFVHWENEGILGSVEAERTLVVASTRYDKDKRLSDDAERPRKTQDSPIWEPVDR